MKQPGDRTTPDIFGEVPAPPPASPPPMHIANYGELGDDFRERERVARKVRRWAGKFRALSTTEQAAIMGALQSIVVPDDAPDPYPYPRGFARIRLCRVQGLDRATAERVLETIYGPEVGR